MSMYGWERYLSIEQDFLRAREYISFDVSNAYSQFFSKQVILLGAEIEGCFKSICSSLGSLQAGNMGDYKKVILESYPGIIHLHTHLLGTDSWLIPFHGWNERKLPWWGVYTDVKHSLVDNAATCSIALNMLAAYTRDLFRRD